MHVPLDPVGLTRSTDAELLGMAQSGDQAALEALLGRHSQALYRFALHLTHNKADAEDVCQETMARAVTRVSSLQSGEAFRSWLFRIARNLSIDHFRRDQKLEPMPEDADDLVPSAAEGPLEILETREEHAIVAEALTTLAPSHQRVLMLREVEGMSYADIATQLNVSHSAVETLLFRARRRLKEQYGKAAFARLVWFAPLRGLPGMISRFATESPAVTTLAVTAVAVGAAAGVAPHALSALRGHSAPPPVVASRVSAGHATSIFWIAPAAAPRLGAHLTRSRAASITGVTVASFIGTHLHPAAPAHVTRIHGSAAAPRHGIAAAPQLPRIHTHVSTAVTPAHRPDTSSPAAFVHRVTARPAARPERSSVRAAVPIRGVTTASRPVSPTPHSRVIVRTQPAAKSSSHPRLNGYGSTGYRRSVAGNTRGHALRRGVATSSVTQRARQRPAVSVPGLVRRNGAVGIAQTSAHPHRYASLHDPGSHPQSAGGGRPPVNSSSHRAAAATHASLTPAPTPTAVPSQSLSPAGQGVGAQQPASASPPASTPVTPTATAVRTTGQGAGRSGSAAGPAPPDHSGQAGSTGTPGPLKPKGK